MIENRSINEAIACVMKYFDILSDEYLLLGVFIIEINLRRLISNPNHEQNHDNDEIDIIDPNTIILKNKDLKNFKIKKKRIDFINEV